MGAFLMKTYIEIKGMHFLEIFFKCKSTSKTIKKTDIHNVLVGP